jgi:DNA-binding NtrC family response regulator
MVTRTKNPRRVVIAHVDTGYADKLRKQLLRIGWEGVVASSAADARSLARSKRTVAAVLDVDLEDESGWLTCVKLLHDQPELRVVLVARDVRPDLKRFADFVGAQALISYRRQAGSPRQLFGGRHSTADV